EGDRPRWRAGETPSGGAAPVVAGTPDADQPRRAREGTSGARRDARPGPPGRTGSETVADERRHLEERARSGTRGRRGAAAGLRQAARDIARSARGHQRRADDGQGSRTEARAVDRAPRADAEHRGAFERAERPLRAREPEGQGARDAAAGGGARRSAGEPG